MSFPNSGRIMQKQDGIISCQAVSEMGWNLLIFNSIIHSKFVLNLKFYQLQSSSKNQGLKLWCFEFGSIPHTFQTIGFWTLGNFWHFWKIQLTLIWADFFRLFLQTLSHNYKILQKKSCWILKALELSLKDQGPILHRFWNARIKT